MPQMNGAEVASILKKTMPNVLIILSTMYRHKFGKSLTAAMMWVFHTPTVSGL
jgi:hypothetical protein